MLVESFFDEGNLKINKNYQKKKKKSFGIRGVFICTCRATGMLLCM